MKKRFKKACAVFLTLGLLLQAGFAGGVSAADPDETPKRFVEAEDGVLLPNASGQYAEIANKSGASGGKSLEVFQDGKGAEYRNIAQSNRITICYANTDRTGVVDVYVNDVKLAAIPFTPTGSWGPPFNTFASADVYIPEGATVKLVNPGTATNIDYIEFTNDPLYDTFPAGHLPAVDAELLGAQIGEDLMSYTGRAVMLPEDGSSITFTVPALQEVKNIAHLRYRAQADAAGTISVNGGAPSPIHLYETAGGMYEDYRKDVGALREGDKITLTLTGDEPVWVDTAALSHLQFDAVEPVDAGTVPEAGDRRSVSLNGTWECVKTDDKLTRMPEFYDNRIPVPGLWDLAQNDLGSYEGASLWYRRSVRFEEIPENVTLKIGKAAYGRYIYVNGRQVDYYTYNYTASETDITPYLIPHAENEIVIRVQNKSQQHSDPASTGHTGYDGERHKYYPGVYDDVSLIFNRDPVISSLQNSPDLENGTVHIRAFLENSSAGTVTTPVTVQIYELGVVKDSREPDAPKLVGEQTIDGVTVGANGEQTVDFPAIKLDGFDRSKYWSPDNPFLYRIVVKTSGDTYQDRFGMRTFHFDAETHQPMLNGEPHFIRGTNVCLYRFFDDPLRSDLPWTETWVRELYDQFQNVNWESFRTHVCFLPERWYEIADEYGFLIFDEYPYWQHCDGCECTTDDLLPEVKNWMTERGMHASVIQWDIQNESYNGGVTTPIIRALRPYDIQNRSWNNGWVAYDQETDSAECHPYLYSNNEFKLGYLNVIDRKPWTLPAGNQNIAMIINETGWNWLNRDGTPTLLGDPWYSKHMPGSTAQERLNYYAESQAQLAEFWRLGGFVQGNLQFTGLSYSVEGGATSDVLQPDITHPQISPYLTDMLRSSFAPLGIAIDNFDEECWHGQQKTFPVTLMNGVNTAFEDVSVDVILYDGDKTLSKQNLLFDVEKMGTVSKECTIVIPEQTDSEQLRLVARYTDQNGEEIFSQRKLTLNYSEHGIALGKKVTASSMKQDSWYQKHYPQNVVDGSNSTYWEANSGDAAPWITLDLGEPMDISKVKLNWTDHYAKRYALEASDDGINFRLLQNGAASAAGDQLFDVESSGRYVRVRVLEPGSSAPGLNEFDVWGVPADHGIAFGKEISASSELSTDPAVNAIDRDDTTCWSSDPAGGVRPWIMLDMGDTFRFSAVKLNWAASAKRYEIQVSNDAASFTTIYQGTAEAAGEQRFEVSGLGRYIRMRCLEPGDGQSCSLREFDVWGESAVQLLSQNQPVHVSSWQDQTVNNHPPAHVNDGSEATRWSSETDGVDLQPWVTIDLGESARISQIRLNWEAAYAKQYQLLVSDDNEHFTPIYTGGASGAGEQRIPVSAKGRYVRMHCLEKGTIYGCSLWEFQVFGYSTLPTGDGIAYGKPITASSVQAGNPVSGANDRNANTRWASDTSEPQSWITLDMGEQMDFSAMSLNWEAAYAKRYDIQVSNDNEHFETVYEGSASGEGLQRFEISGTGRYIRVQCLEKGSAYGYSLWEIDVWGKPAAKLVPIDESLSIDAGILRGVLPSTSADALKEMFVPADGTEILVSRDGQPLSGSDIVGTGCIIGLMKDGKILDEARILILGDVSGDGLHNLTDLISIKRMILGHADADFPVEAADVNHDGRINIFDLLELKLAILNGTSL